MNKDFYFENFAIERKYNLRVMRMKFLWNLEIPIIFSDKNSRSNRIKKGIQKYSRRRRKKEKKNLQTNVRSVGLIGSIDRA